MIGRDDVIPMLLEAVPSFSEEWNEIEYHPLFWDEETETSLDHVVVRSVFAQHVVRLQRSEATGELTRLFEVVEMIHTDGDEYVQNLATIGLLEGIQFACSHTTDVPQEEFEPYLGPESRRWWRGLNAFWSGNIPRVQALDED